jgi:hypothetical protein
MHVPGCTCEVRLVTADETASTLLPRPSSIESTLKTNLAVPGVRYVSVVIQERGRNKSAHLCFICGRCRSWSRMSADVSLGEARSAKPQLVEIERRTR